ncbi:DNA cytosine methyltransferase [Sphingoaurantiacus capsulatus]|uniref:DNA (cytosine-5-)-methyltransferase n=1 Tax=Sphingoaurantiacus capsulatus TaxID=1771310 RepID=A0ABV7X8H6_9SPHN
MTHSRTPERPVVLSFFSGGMGLDLGLERVGLGAFACLEIDRWCCETIRQNRPNIEVLEQDISRFDWPGYRASRGIDDVFLLVGGPPCQSFSTGGNRAGLSDPRGNLLYEFLSKINVIRPKYFVLENVASITTSALRHRPIKDRPGQHWSLKRYDTANVGIDGNAPLSEDEMGGSAIRQILCDVEKLGYSFTFGIVDSADYGAPQKRFRFVLIGSRDGPAPALPTPTNGPYAELPYATVRDAIADLEDEPGAHSSYTGDVARFFDLVPEGGNWRSLPKELQPVALGNSFAAGGGKTGFFRRLAWDAPSPTITGKANRKGTSMCHPSRTRPLSVRECARLQGFPDDWVFSGAMNKQYLQIGNAVPVALGAAIGRAILEQRKPITYDREIMLEAAVKRLRAAAANKKSTPQPRNFFDMVA